MQWWLWSCGVVQSAASRFLQEWPVAHIRILPPGWFYKKDDDDDDDDGDDDDDDDDDDEGDDLDGNLQLKVLGEIVRLGDILLWFGI